MKTILKQFTALTLLSFIIIFSSFKPALKNSSANGAGVADGIFFSFNAVKQKDGAVVGSIQYGNDAYTIVNAEWFGNAAILYTDSGAAFYVADNGGPRATDWISDPIYGDPSNRYSPSDFYGKHNVTGGNIQVKS